MRFSTLSITAAGLFGALLGAVTVSKPSPLVSLPQDRAILWSAPSMCEFDSDPVACLIAMGEDPVPDDDVLLIGQDLAACRIAAEEPTDGNLRACYGEPENGAPY